MRAVTLSALEDAREEKSRENEAACCKLLLSSGFLILGKRGCQTVQRPAGKRLTMTLVLER